MKRHLTGLVKRGLRQAANDLNHPIEIFDNMSDVAHLGHLHGGHARAYENEYDGHLMHQRQRSAVDPIPGVFDETYSTLSGYVGPGFAFGRFVELHGLQLILVTPIEDGTGSTVAFAIDGTSYEIDLSDAHAGELRDALAPYLRAGRRVSSTRRASSGSRSSGSAASEAAAMREWATARGMKVSQRGRVGADVVEAYRNR